jgi:hypothetical protein
MENNRRPCSDVIADLERLSYRMHAFVRMIRDFLNNPTEENEQAVLRSDEDLQGLLREYRTAFSQLGSCEREPVAP